MAKINLKGTRIVKDGEDWHGLQTKNLKNLGETLQDAQTAGDVALLIHWCFVLRRPRRQSYIWYVPVCLCGEKLGAGNER